MLNLLAAFCTKGKSPTGGTDCIKGYLRVGFWIWWGKGSQGYLVPRKIHGINVFNPETRLFNCMYIWAFRETFVPNSRSGQPWDKSPIRLGYTKNGGALSRFLAAIFRFNFSNSFSACLFSPSSRLVVPTMPCC